MTNNELFGQLESIMQYAENSNNYDKNRIIVYMYAEGIEISSCHRNEYGGLYGNNDEQLIYWQDIPTDLANYLITEVPESFLVIDWEE